MLLAYAACRLVSGVLLAVVAMRQVPTGWTGPDVSYLTFTAQWDGQWYLHIAEQGYPRRLPTDANGLVQQNAWAFYPLFPFLSRVLMDLTHLDFYWVGSTLSLLLGFVAAGRHGAAAPRPDRERFTIAAVVLWASLPAAVVLQVGYTEAMAMALLTLFLLALSRERWLWAMSLALLLGLTRPDRRADRGRHRRGALVPMAGAGRAAAGAHRDRRRRRRARGMRRVRAAVAGDRRRGDRPGQRVHGDHVDLAGEPGDRPVQAVAGHVAVLLRTRPGARCG